jgi:hypothetical protein
VLTLLLTAGLELSIIELARTRTWDQQSSITNSTADKQVLLEVAPCSRHDGVKPETEQGANDLCGRDGGMSHALLLESLTTAADLTVKPETEPQQCAKDLGAGRWRHWVSSSACGFDANCLS